MGGGFWGFGGGKRRGREGGEEEKKWKEGHGEEKGKGCRE